MYGYIYLTRNKLNNKKYIGKHRAEVFDEKYIGSGKYLRKAIKKYGVDNFECSILCWCETLDELNEKEIELIEKFKAVDKNDFYNLAKGGEGNTSERTPETIKKLSESLKKYVFTEEHKRNLSIAALNRSPRKFKFKNRKPMTEEHKRKIVETRRRNNSYVVSEESRKRMSEAHKNQIPWNKGKKLKNIIVEESALYID